MATGKLHIVAPHLQGQEKQELKTEQLLKNWVEQTHRVCSSVGALGRALQDGSQNVVALWRTFCQAACVTGGA